MAEFGDEKHDDGEKGNEAGDGGRCFAGRNATTQGLRDPKNCIFLQGNA